jgi:cysteinyl-tRNA synthetase
VRLALLTAHYRQPLDWTDQLVTETRQKLDRMYGALREAGLSGPMTRAPAAPPPAGMLAALEDDLNTPEAIAELFGVVRAANRATDAAEKRALAESLRSGAWLLGLLVQDPGVWFKGPQISASTAQITPTSHPASATLAASPEDAEIDTLVQQRDAFRKERNFAEADRIRRQLTERGIVIEDATGGARWRRSR